MSNLPRAFLVTLGLLGGLFLIYILNPPFTACTAQYEVVQKKLTPYLYLDKKKPHIKVTGLQRAVDDCKKTNNSGGCFPLFENTQSMIQDLKIVSPECREEVYGKDEIRNALFSSLQFMVTLAWGVKAPKTEFERDGWYDGLNKTIFCDLKAFIQNNFDDDWAGVVDQVLESLPEATELTGEKGWREIAWNRSVFATPCSQFK